MMAAERAGKGTPAAVISARAVARLSEVFTVGWHLAGPSTIWLLPKGRSGDVELAEAQLLWTGMFHVEQSLTADDSIIVIARKVQRI
jgi:16S rRNA (guanine527-N7)-methyltransferase